MLLSMTGYASCTKIIQIKGEEDICLSVEMKTLNSRFFEATCKLPNSLGFLEIPIVNMLKKKLLRGRVFISVRLSGGGGLFETVVPVLKLAKDYSKAAATIKEHTNVSGELTLSDLITLPNIFSFEHEEIDKQFETAVLDLVGTAVEKVLASRTAEGQSLEKDLTRRFENCTQSIEEIKALSDRFMKEQKEEAKKLLDLSKNGDQEAEQNLHEKYELINKIDINEEIVRFKNHLKASQDLLKKEDAEKGKRFEFMVQELSREVNTIAAKCSFFDISSIAVDIKVELEKVREQVQNLV